MQSPSYASPPAPSAASQLSGAEGARWSDRPFPAPERTVPDPRLQRQRAVPAGSPRATELLAHALAAQLGADLLEGPEAWVVLTAELAWRVPKPPARDRMAPELSRHACEQAVRLGRQLAPRLVLGVDAIHGSIQQPRLGDGGPPIAHAVRMLRHPLGTRLRDLVAAGEPVQREVDALAALLARFHERAPVAPDGGLHGRAARHDDPPPHTVPAGICNRSQERALQAFLRDESARLEPVWRERQARARVRACHGNLHLGNVVRDDVGVAALDPLTGLARWRDVVEDIALPVVDLWAMGERAAAFRLLDRWLEHTGDTAAVPALRLAAVEQALRLARCAAQHGPSPRPRARLYVQAALDWIERPRLQLTVTCGGSEAERAAAAQALLERLGALCLRAVATGDGRACERLLAEARACMAEGYPVVLQGSFLRRAERDLARRVAHDLHAQFCIVAAGAPERASRAADPLAADEWGYVQHLQA